MIGETFTRDGYTFTVQSEYLPGMFECRGQSGVIVIPEIEIRDSLACSCGHKAVSHGSFIGGEFVGTGLGPCGVDRDTRNAASGWIGDPCPCEKFEQHTA